MRTIGARERDGHAVVRVFDGSESPRARIETVIRTEPHGIALLAVERQRHRAIHLERRARGGRCAAPNHRLECDHASALVARCGEPVKVSRSVTAIGERGVRGKVRCGERGRASRESARRHVEVDRIAKGHDLLERCGDRHGVRRIEAELAAEPRRPDRVLLESDVKFFQRVVGAVLDFLHLENAERVARIFRLLGDIKVWRRIGRQRGNRAAVESRRELRVSGCGEIQEPRIAKVAVVGLVGKGDGDPRARVLRESRHAASFVEIVGRARSIRAVGRSLDPQRHHSLHRDRGRRGAHSAGGILSRECDAVCADVSDRRLPVERARVVAVIGERRTRRKLRCAEVKRGSGSARGGHGQVHHSTRIYRRRDRRGHAEHGGSIEQDFSLERRRRLTGVLLKGSPEAPHPSAFDQDVLDLKIANFRRRVESVPHVESRGIPTRSGIRSGCEHGAVRGREMQRPGAGEVRLGEGDGEFVIVPWIRGCGGGERSIGRAEVERRAAADRVVRSAAHRQPGDAAHVDRGHRGIDSARAVVGRESDAVGRAALGETRVPVEGARVVAMIDEGRACGKIRGRQLRGAATLVRGVHHEINIVVVGDDLTDRGKDLRDHIHIETKLAPQRGGGAVGVLFEDHPETRDRLVRPIRDVLHHEAARHRTRAAPVAIHLQPRIAGIVKRIVRRTRINGALKKSISRRAEVEMPPLGGVRIAKRDVHPVIQL